MTTPHCPLYAFLKAVEGNWRNAVFISCSSPTHLCDGGTGREGFLLSADDLGRPLLVSVETYRKYTGEPICPDECCSTIPCQTFTALYGQYLKWNLSDSSHCQLEQISMSPNCEKQNK